jgi:Lar family restriction alleviation protein
VADLTPCPFCGGNAEWDPRDWDPATATGDDGTGRIRCLACDASTPVTDRGDAATRWNRRVIPADGQPAKVCAVWKKKKGFTETLRILEVRKCEDGQIIIVQ